MKFLNYDIDYTPGESFTVWPIGDQHRVNVNSDLRRQRKVSHTLQSDPNALVIMMGDLHDCIVPSDTRRWDSAAIDYTLIDPAKVDKMADEVVRDGVEYVADFWPKVLVMHRGNHEEYLDDKCNTTIGRNICRELGDEDRYSEGMCTTTLRFKDGNKHVAEFVINSSHGGQVPQSDGAAVSSMQKKLQHFKDVDLLVRGHSHRTFIQPIASLSRRKNGEDLVDNVAWICHSSSYLQTYAAGRQCYGEEKDYSPTVLLNPRLVLTPVRNRVYAEGRI